MTLKASYLALLLFLSLLWNAAHSTDCRAEVLQAQFELSPSEIRLIARDGHLHPQVPMGVSIEPAGNPDLPAVSVWFSIPPNHRAVSAEIVDPQYAELPGTYDLGAAAGGVLTTDWRPISLDGAWALRADWYPEQNPRVSDGRLRGQGVAAVVVRPLQFQGTTGSLRYLKSAQVVLRTEPTQRAEPLTIERESPSGAESTTQMLAMLGLESPVTRAHQDRVLTPLVNSGTPGPRFNPTVDGSPVDMVIITPESQASAYQVLADYKTQIGLVTVVRTVEWVQANYPKEIDTQATLRAFIKDAASKWGTSNVLLGGDTEQVPTRVVDFFGEVAWQIPSDNYYSCLDGNWNADGDSRFGEGQTSSVDLGDQVDLYPDVYVGRLPSATSSEATLMVAKVLRYLRNPPQNFGLNALFLGEVLFPQNWDGTPASIETDGADLCQELIALGRIPLSVTVTAKRLYENAGSFEGSIAETKSNVLSELNVGHNLVHFVGHGFENTLSVGQSGDQLKNSDVAGLANATRQGIFFGMTCNAATTTKNCIAESWLRNSAGGAVAVISNSSISQVYADRDYEQEWYRLLYGQNELGILGYTTGVAKILSLPYAEGEIGIRSLHFNTHLLGDPQMWFWRNEPKRLTISFTSTVALGAGSLTVTVTDSVSTSTPLVGAHVCAYKANDAIAQGVTDANGQVTLTFKPDEVGTFTVGAWYRSVGQTTLTDYVPKVMTGTVVQPAAAYLFDLTQLIDDSATSPANGNGDGHVDAGETVLLKLRLKNTGTSAASGVTASISCTDPYVTISDATGSYSGSIAPGGQGDPTDPMTLTVLRTCPEGRAILVSLSISTSSGSFTNSFRIYVHRPAIEYFRHAVRDSLADNDGVPETGELLCLRPYVTNRGTGAARGLQIRLRSLDTGVVTITDSVAVLGNLLPGDQGVNPSDVLKCTFSSFPTAPKLRAVFVDQYGEIGSTLLDVQPPPAVTNLIGFGEATAIALSWTPTTSQDVRGYNVYRSTSFTGTYQRLNAIALERTSYYHDEGLPATTRYYYKVASVDSAGNEGGLFGPVTATTSLPLHPGFPVKMEAAVVSGVTLVDLLKNGTMNILTGGEEIYALKPDGSEVIDGDNDVRNLGPFSSTGRVEFWNTPAVGDINNDGQNEVAAIGWRDAKLYVWNTTGQILSGFPKSLNPDAIPDPNPLGSVALYDIDNDGYLEVFALCANRLFGFRHNGTEIRDGDNNPLTVGVFCPPFTLKYNYGTPSFGNLDGDPQAEIFVPTRDGVLHVLNHDGTLVPGFPFTAPGNITSSPAIADLNWDGRPEIIFASSAAGGAKPTVTRPITKLDGADSRAALRGLSTPGPTRAPKLLLHVMAPTNKNACTAGNLSGGFSANTQGALYPATHFVYVLGAHYTPEYGMAGMSVGIDYNGVATQGVDVYSWTKCAAVEYATSGWPADGGGNRLTWNRTSSDAIVGCQTDSLAVAGYFYLAAYTPDRLSLIANPSSGRASFADCSAREEGLRSDNLGYVDFGGGAGYNPCKSSGSQSALLHVLSNTGVEKWYVEVPLSEDWDSSPAIGDVDSDGKLDIILGGSDGKVYGFRHDGTNVPGLPVQLTDGGGAQAVLRSSPVLADIDNDVEQYNEIFIGDQSGLVHGLHFDGVSTWSALAGLPTQTGGVVEGGLAVWDLDANGFAELVACSYDQAIYVWDIGGSTEQGFNESTTYWPMFKKGPRHDGNVSNPVWVGQTAVPDSRTKLRPKLRVSCNPCGLEANTIGITLTSADKIDAHTVRLRCYDVMGREVHLIQALVAEAVTEARYRVLIGPGDGRETRSGVYFIVAVAGGVRAGSARVVLTR